MGGIFHTRCPFMKLGNILCNKCYCAIDESKKSNNNNRLSVHEQEFDKSYHNAASQRKKVFSYFGKL